MDLQENHQVGLPPTQLPEWEVPKGHNGLASKSEAQGAFRFSKGASGHRDMLRTKLDRFMPSHRKYCGLSRRMLLILLVLAILVLLALIIGLSVGLTRHTNSYNALPAGQSQYTGDLTYYSPGLGACGVTSTPDQDIVSISHFVFDSAQTGSNPNTNPLCGLVIRAERFDEQVNALRSVDLTIVDRCTGCQPTDLDVSPGAFAQMADPAKGRVDVTWAWLSPTPMGIV